MFAELCQLDAEPDGRYQNIIAKHVKHQNVKHRVFNIYKHCKQREHVEVLNTEQLNTVKHRVFNSF